MTRTERPAWVDDADPITVNDTQWVALRRVHAGWVRCRIVHQSWVHHSTRDALVRRGLIVVDDLGYVTLTDAGRQAVR